MREREGQKVRIDAAKSRGVGKGGGERESIEQTQKRWRQGTGRLALGPAPGARVQELCRRQAQAAKQLRPQMRGARQGIGSSGEAREDDTQRKADDASQEVGGQRRCRGCRDWLHRQGARTYDSRWKQALADKSTQELTGADRSRG